MKTIATLALAAVAAGSAAAQGRPAQVPAELATALLTEPWDAEVKTVITPGAPPAGIAAQLIPAAPVTVLGGLQHGGDRSVILVYPASAGDAAEAYRGFLAAHGWTAPALPSARPGFVSSMEATMRRAWLCNDSTMATVIAVPGAPAGSSWVRAGFRRREAEGDPCAISYGAMSEGPREDLQFPTLIAPAGVQAQGGGGGGSQFSRSSSTRLLTAMAPAEIAAHYAPQLERAGWTVGALLTSADVALRPVTARDAKGREWRGALLVTTSGNARDVLLHMSRVGSR